MITGNRINPAMQRQLPKSLFMKDLPEAYKHSTYSPGIPTGKMKVCLVNPISKEYLFERQPAVSAQILKGYIRATTDASVEIVDMQKALDCIQKEKKNQDIPPDKLYYAAIERMLHEIEYISPNIIGFSMKVGTDMASETMLHILRRDTPPEQKTLFVVGNLWPTFESDKLLRRSTFQGVVAVLGEGEKPFKEIIERASTLDDFSDPASYKGIRGVKVDPGEAVKMENLTLEDYPYLPETNVPEMYFDEARFQLETSRGCQWRACSFCSINGLYGSAVWRPFPVEWVLDTVERRIRSGALMGYLPMDQLGFSDSDFLGIGGKMTEEMFMKRVERAKALAEGLKRLRETYSGCFREPFTYGPFSLRVDAIYKEGEDERNKTRVEVLRTLKEAGLEEAYIGVESGNEKDLRIFMKGVTIAESEKALKILREVGIGFHIGYITWTHWMTKEMLRQNIEFLGRNGLQQQEVLSNEFRFQPGCRLTEKCTRGNQILEEFAIAYLRADEIVRLSIYLDYIKKITDELGVIGEELYVDSLREAKGKLDLFIAQKSSSDSDSSSENQ